MDIPTIIALVIGAVDFIALVIGGVWAVGKIQSTADVTSMRLSTTIEHLDATVDGLSKTIERLESLGNAHEARISVLEDRDDRSREPYHPARRRNRQKDEQEG